MLGQLCLIWAKVVFIGYQAPSYIIAHPALIFEWFFNLKKVSVEIDWAQFYITNYI